MDFRESVHWIEIVWTGSPIAIFALWTPCESGSRGRTNLVRRRRGTWCVGAAGADVIAEAVELIRAAKQPVLLVGHGVHTTR
ncbi:hypothetical protein, partial [Nocardia aurea]|uniref:hypothetical protein n=1 Tax=Nocardia aurea TaxID=2144174 RepID=UPI0033B83E05